MGENTRYAVGRGIDERINFHGAAGAAPLMEFLNSGLSPGLHTRISLSRTINYYPEQQNARLNGVSSPRRPRRVLLFARLGGRRRPPPAWTPPPLEPPLLPPPLLPPPCVLGSAQPIRLPSARSRRWRIRPDPHSRQDPFTAKRDCLPILQ